MRGTAGQIAKALSALSFGVPGWCAAHGLTWWLLTHQQVINGAPQGHHHGLAELALVAAFVGVGTLLSMLVVSRRSEPLAVPTFSRRTDLRRAAGLSIGAYLVGELGETRLVEGQGLPNPLVLLTGVVIYLVTSLVMTVLWRDSTEAMQRVAVSLARRHPRPFDLTVPSRHPAPLAHVPLTQQRRPAVHFGRGPPSVTV